MTESLKCLIVSALVLFLIGCGGGGGGGKSGRSTGPTEQETAKLNEGKAAAEVAERAYYEKKLERIQLEQQLEDRK